MWGVGGPVYITICHRYAPAPIGANLGRRRPIRLPHTATAAPGPGRVDRAENTKRTGGPGPGRDHSPKKFMRKRTPPGAAHRARRFDASGPRTGTDKRHRKRRAIAAGEQIGAELSVALCRGAVDLLGRPACRGRPTRRIYTEAAAASKLE